MKSRRWSNGSFARGRLAAAAPIRPGPATVRAASAEELWAGLEGPWLLAYASWPKVDPAMLVDDEVEIAVQVLGKVRGRVMVPTGAGNEIVLVAARQAVASHLAGKTVHKEIVVPGKLVNFVVK